MAQVTRGQKDGGAGSQALPRVLSVLFLLAAFIGTTLLYRHTFSFLVATPEEEAEAPQQQQAGAQAEDNVYYGVEDPWVGGVFTTGNRELDEQVKAFCDAKTKEGQSGASNAYNTYIAIVWSDFEARGVDEAPAGTDWVMASARRFFKTGDVETGAGYRGDNYDRACATAFCLRYFGYFDASCMPIASAEYANYNAGTALVFVTDEYGVSRVCDPNLAANGWMLPREQYNVTVENIGQDLSQAEALGLTIHTPESTVVDTSAGI